MCPSNRIVSLSKGKLHEVFQLNILRTEWLATRKCVIRGTGCHKKSNTVVCMSCLFNSGLLIEDFSMRIKHYTRYGPDDPTAPRCDNCNLAIDVVSSSDECELCKIIDTDFVAYVEVSGSQIFLQQGTTYVHPKIKE